MLLMLAMILPILLVGTLSTYYYRDTIRQNIWEDYIVQARGVSALTANYFDTGLQYLESQSDRPSVINAFVERNISFLNDTLFYIKNTSVFYAIFMVDKNGTVLVSYPYTQLIGKNESGRAFVKEGLLTGNSVISDAIISPVTGKPVVYVVAPVTYPNLTSVGALIGAVNLYNFSDFIINAFGDPGRQHAYLVNKSGNIMVHHDHSYMDRMKNYSMVPGVQKVLAGETGVLEQYNPVENEWRLAAFSPVHGYGWGVVVSQPVNIAYKPINDATRAYVGFIVLLTLLAALLSTLIGNYFVNPILSLTRATQEIPDGDYNKYLPKGRKDEIGILSRAFERMAGIIKSDQQRIKTERDHAEEERKRSELYVDIMGHDINNLNQTALTNLELMQLSPGLNDEQRDLLGNAIASVRGSADIIDNVRKIQRITGEAVTMERVDLDKMILDAIKEAPKPADKKLTIDYKGGKSMPVSGISLIKEAFSNLINNSIKYSGPEVTVSISADEILVDDKKYYQVNIEDTGYGIPDDVKPKLFRRYQRGTTKGLGTGLGLYIVKMLIERFGGTVSVEDRVKGDYKKGTRFIVTLPAADLGDAGA